MASPTCTISRREQSAYLPRKHSSSDCSSKNSVSSSYRSPVNSIKRSDGRKTRESPPPSCRSAEETLRSDLAALADQAYRSLEVGHDSTPVSHKQHRPLPIGYSYSVVEMPASRPATPDPSKGRFSRGSSAGGTRRSAHARPGPARHDSLASSVQRRCRMNSLRGAEGESPSEISDVLKRKDSGTALVELSDTSLRVVDRAAELEETYYRAVSRACQLGESRHRATAPPPRTTSPWARPDCPPDPLYHPEIARGLGVDPKSLRSRPITPEAPNRSIIECPARTGGEGELPEYVKQLRAHGLIGEKDLKHWNVKRKSAGSPRHENKAGKSGKHAGNALRGLLKKPQPASLRSISLS